VLDLTSYHAFIHERMKARTGESLDPILKKWHFTNVIRDLDPGTQWFRDWRAARKFDVTDVMWGSMIYRWLNRRATFDRHPIPEMNAAAVQSWWDECDVERRAGVRLGSKYHWTNFTYTLENSLRAIDHLPRLEDDLRAARNGVEFTKVLYVLRGVGPFTALQMTADYVGDPESHLPATTFMPLAIGSRIGIHLLMTGEFRSNSIWDARVRHTLGISPVERDVMLELYQRRPLEEMTYVDIEHSLCEWYKWRCLQVGRGVRMFKR